MTRHLALLSLVALVACGPTTLTLNDFESAADLDRLTWRCPMWLQATDQFVTSGRAGLLVEFPTGVYPTLELWDVPADWGRHRWFEADLFAPDAGGEELMIRIDDQGDCESFADRFEITVPLTGAPQQVRIPLDRVARGNGGHPLDLRHMKRVLFYLKSADRRITWFLDGVRVTQ